MRVVIIAMSALLCVSCASQDRQAAPVSSDVSSASALPSSVAQSLEEQAEVDGPVLGSRMATTMCIENLSSVTPVVTFDQKDEQAGEGPLKYRARACATGLSSGQDVRGRIGVPAPNAPMEFWADNRKLGYPGGGLDQEEVAICLGSMTFSVGDRRTWDDGLLLYALERESDGVGKVFRITIRDSAKPSADGKPAKCTIGGGGAIALS
jgi:hypothetical protein